MTPARLLWRLRRWRIKPMATYELGDGGCFYELWDHKLPWCRGRQAWMSSN